MKTWAKSAVRFPCFYLRLVDGLGYAARPDDPAASAWIELLLEMIGLISARME
jgi:hypothetical protein